MTKNTFNYHILLYNINKITKERMEPKTGTDNYSQAIPFAPN